MSQFTGNIMFHRMKGQYEAGAPSEAGLNPTQRVRDVLKKRRKAWDDAKASPQSSPQHPLQTTRSVEDMRKSLLSDSLRYKYPKPAKSLDEEMKGAVARAVTNKANREQAASVDLMEAERASKPVGMNSLTSRQSARDGISRSGSIADRGSAKTGRGYYHPDRIRERALRRDEKWRQMGG